jgi:multidrug efflux system outer membrane protein
MHTIKNIIIIIFCTTLSGCHIYRAYQRPDSVTVSDSLYRQPVAVEDTVSLASLSWKELFTDPQLQQLIETGLNHNTDLNIARLKVKEAEALLMTSRLSYLPSVSLTPQGTLSSTDGSKTSKTYNLAVSADWEIDLFGKLLNAKRGAQATLEQSEAYRQAVQTQLVATIANSYYTLLMLDKQIDITRRTADTWTESVRAMKALKRAGQATEMAVAQTEASKLSVDASILTLERQINEMENSLSTLLSLSPQAIGRSTLESQQFPDSLSTGIPLQLLNRRPDVRQCEAQLATAYYATNSARSAFYPSITLSGSAGWTNGTGAVISNPGQWLLSAVGSLVQPLFNRGKNIANLKITKAQQEEALLTFQQSLLNAGAEVNDALVQWQTARQRIQIDEQQSASLRSALRSAELLMQHSSQNYLEVLTARQTLLQAELNTVTDRFDEIQGVINLYHALGGGY